MIADRPDYLEGQSPEFWNPKPAMMKKPAAQADWREAGGRLGVHVLPDFFNFQRTTGQLTIRVPLVAFYSPIEGMRLISDLGKVVPYAINGCLRIHIALDRVWSARCLSDFLRVGIIPKPREMGAGYMLKLHFLSQVVRLAIVFPADQLPRSHELARVGLLCRNLTTNDTQYHDQNRAQTDQDQSTLHGATSLRGYYIPTDWQTQAA